MMPKKNFKYLIAGHIIAIVLFGILLFLTADKSVLLLMMVLVVVSLMVQLLVYKVKPGFFSDKTTNHPDAK